MGSNIGTGVGPRCHGAIDRNMGGKTRRRCFLMVIIASDGRGQGKKLSILGIEDRSGSLFTPIPTSVELRQKTLMFAGCLLLINTGTTSI
jgi:hypothetical protein